MRRLIAIAAMALTAVACGSAGHSDTTEAVPDQGATMVPAAPTPEPPASESPAPEDGAPDSPVVPDASAMVATDDVPTISLPEPSGDPELDALGAELAGLEQQLLALDAASLDLGGTP